MSNTSKSTSVSAGTNTCGLLGVAFIVLKLCGIIDWSWWWVTCPFWGGAALALAILAAIAIGGLLVLLFVGIFAYFSK